MNIENEECYKAVLNRINGFKSEQFRTKLSEYYIKEYRKKVRSGRFKNYSSNFDELIKSINIPQIEYYIEYCLLFYEEDFYDFLKAVYEICIDFCIILKSICVALHNFNSIKDVEEEINNINVPKMKKTEVQQLIQYIIEEEKKHVLICYDSASNDLNFCDVCMPYCPQKTKKLMDKNLNKSN